MKILIVEDEAGISNFLKQGLEEEGFTVDVAEEGNLGMKLALSGAYDILLLDWMLPGFSGIEICEQFREKDVSTPILFLTAKDTVEETILGLKAGANDYIKKPFHFEELLERIKVQLRPRSDKNQVLTLGEISLNLRNYQVFSQKKEVQLTQREFDLLKYLLQNKGKVCTRTDIIKDVWNIHFEYDSGVIDVNINALRRKLGIGSEQCIQTIRGVGYMAKEA